jgi:2-polyprenyl-6-methoxyphenol hydroxylase-like FAD-dependent oxidoreductase
MRKALIIGGGIAGPVAAMALQSAGFDVVVYEAHQPIGEDVGSYLSVATNGLDALHALEIDGSIRATGFPTRHNVLLSSTGKRLGEISNGGTLQDGTVAHTIKRAHLYRALHQHAVQRGVPCEFGKRLVIAEPAADGVVATFEDGTRAGGDLLIGCDGIYSVTRGLIDPAAPSPRYVGLVNFGGYTTGLHVPVEPGNWYMVFGRRAFFGYVVDPVGGIVWFANVPRDPVSDAERAATSVGQWKQQLIELFSDDQSPASVIIDAGEFELIADNTHDLPSVPTWSKGPMAIIGDAAHAPSPTSGQGASLACEDAVILAKCLRDLPDTAKAFAVYEQLRRQRVERIVAQAARVGGRKAPGVLGSIVRDAVLPFVFKFMVTDKSQGWIYKHHIDWNAPLELEAVGAA